MQESKSCVLSLLTTPQLNYLVKRSTATYINFKAIFEFVDGCDDQILVRRIQFLNALSRLFAGIKLQGLRRIIKPQLFRKAALLTYGNQKIILVFIKNAISCIHLNPLVKTGGEGRDRTDDILLAKQALSQLSYNPILLGAKRLNA